MKSESLKRFFAYTNVGHDKGDILWVYKDGELITAKSKNSADTHRTRGLPVPYPCGRYEAKRGIVSFHSCWTPTPMSDVEKIKRKLEKKFKDAIYFAIFCLD